MKVGVTVKMEERRMKWQNWTRESRGEGVNEGMEGGIKGKKKEESTFTKNN